MIGGNIPGRTRVMSTAIFDFVETMRWREANLLAGGMVVFAFVVILSMILHREALHAAGRVTRRPAIRARFRGMLGKFALDAAFTAPARGVTALFGPSGCGKTTVLRCIAGLFAHATASFRSTATSGRTRTARSCRPTGARSAMCFRKRACSSISRVRRNLLFGAPRGNRDGSKGGIDFDEVVDLLGIGALLDRSPRNLSGGERQRVAIGRALLTQPKLLLMDEPLSALDRATKNEILPFLERLRDRLKLPVVYITHDIAEVERLADQIVLMDKGHVIGAGTARRRCRAIPSLPLAAARDAAVEPRGRRRGAATRLTASLTQARGGVLIAPAPPAAVGERRRIRVIASDVSLAREPPAASSILNVLPARIVSTKPVGPQRDHCRRGARPRRRRRAPAWRA